MFFGGILAVFMMLLLQVLGDLIASYEIHDLLGGVVSDEATLVVLEEFWQVVQEYNPVALMKAGSVALIVVFVVAGALEELLKQWLVRVVDSRNLLIKDINTSIQYSLVAALGFAFAENVYYFYAIWTRLGSEFLIGPVVFRSTFTTAAHMCFSGLWGYYYGRGKFCVNIVEQQKWRNQGMFLTKVIAWATQMPVTQAFREQMILKGLVIAMLFHGVFNYLLEVGSVLPVMLSVIAAFGYLIYLLNKKSGNLMLVNDIDSRQVSTMGKRDEETVIEYIGILYNQGQYDQVVETCERLLERDPDNNVVKLFQAKALDKKKLQGYVRTLIAKKQQREQ